MKAGGYNLPRIFPGTGATNNLMAAVVLLNRAVQVFLGVASAERDLLSTEELEAAYRGVDDLVDQVLALIRRTLES